MTMKQRLEMHRRIEAENRRKLEQWKRRQRKEGEKWK